MDTSCKWILDSSNFTGRRRIITPQYRPCSIVQHVFLLVLFKAISDYLAIKFSSPILFLGWRNLVFLYLYLSISKNINKLWYNEPTNINRMEQSWPSASSPSSLPSSFSLTSLSWPGLVSFSKNYIPIFRQFRQFFLLRSMRNRRWKAPSAVWIFLKSTLPSIYGHCYQYFKCPGNTYNIWISDTEACWDNMFTSSMFKCVLMTVMIRINSLTWYIAF